MSTQFEINNIIADSGNFLNAPEGAFVPPCPGEEYVLDETTGLWVIPS